MTQNNDDHRRMRLFRLLRGRDRERQRQRRNLVTGLLLVMLTFMGFAAFPYGDLAYATMGCGMGFGWPIMVEGNPNLVQRFDNPPKPWLAGHRGLDLQASSGTELFSPSSGILTFAGQVGGKNVLTIDHGDGISTTYEPATTMLPVGTILRKGESFGRVDGHSDHCDGNCLHWGLRQGKRQYRNPEHAVRPQRIALKPVDDNS
ncbi:M23 family metallopeptidase [Bifidobacterium callimiconis]|uniref:Peptidase M23 n=1 Tax=Bifidobacterium callimiconis TaxID=2306973 RepID=A0A430FHB1_9BIFI|nr:M23 family metallopeptidase [Bifidobacterium callimiconis]RSX52273.1 peptidase M23 [Bifidobacterium callimiconis]